MSLEEIIKKLIAYYKKLFPGVHITSSTDVGILMSGGMGGARSSKTIYAEAVEMFSGRASAPRGFGRTPHRRGYTGAKKAKKAAKKTVKKARKTSIVSSLELKRPYAPKKAVTKAEASKNSSGQAPQTSDVSDNEEKKKVRTDLNYTVWFGTNRRPINVKDLSNGFSGDRDEKVHLGLCKVHVPKSHRIGSTGSGWWKRLFSGVDDRLKLTAIEKRSKNKFWQAVASTLKELKPGDREAVIFIHGYNVTFESAALRAAQLGTDLAVKGCMAFFSWPSKGKVRPYVADEASIESCEAEISEFLIDFAERSGASKVHIIAHSMGNRGILRAVNRIASTAATKSGKPFDQIILAAADVDAGTFRMLSKAYSKVARRTTLYVSSRDRAVEAAQWLHDYARAGLTPPIMVVPGINTVNVTNADLTQLGHGYVTEARGVLTDIFALLRFGAGPSKRFGLSRQTSEDGKTYWLIGQ